MGAKFFVTLSAVLVVGALGCKKKVTDSRTASTDSDSPAASSPSTSDQVATSQATKLVLIGADMAQAASACGPLVVQVEDNDGFGANVAADVTVKVTSSAATGSFYSDEACATKVDSVKIATGASDAQVFYKDTAVGTATITFADAKTDGGLASASGTLLIDVITKLAFLDATFTQTVGTCGYLVVEAQGAGNAAVRTAADVVINLTSSAATGQFFSDDGCTAAVTSVKINQGSSESIPVYYKDTAAGSPTISATEVPTQGWTAASLAATVN